MQDFAPSSPVPIGSVVADKYRVERILGVGGMGVVVAARHVTLDQVVAIKFLVADRTGQSREEAVARFLTEARAAARIDSDHVCRVFDVAMTPTGIPFMVMEYLEGNDLEEELDRRGQLGITEGVDYVLQAAEAIAAAHQIGIVHRDMKPANIFLTVRPDGSRRVKVLDFGISKTLSMTPPRAEGNEGTSLGTPAYMSPEQVRASHEVDGRTDVWALGAILYEALTGQMAFVGKDLKEVLDMVTNDDPCPISALRRDVPPELEQIVKNCLERDRDNRFASAAHLARALAPWGSVGIVTALTSVQRELGSLASIKAVAAQSVEPMVASVRNLVVTRPDPAEISQRGAIAQDWSKDRAHRRSARTAIITFLAVTSMAAAAALVVVARQRFAAHETNAAAAQAAPPPPASDPAPSIEPTTPPVASVYPAASSVQSAHTSAPRAPPPRAATPPARAPSKGGVNHLLDTRD